MDPCGSNIGGGGSGPCDPCGVDTYAELIAFIIHLQLLSALIVLVYPFQVIRTLLLAVRKMD